MKNEKGMTLVEVIVAMALLVIIATVFFRTATFGYVNLIDSNKFTKDSFDVQKDIENTIQKLETKSVDDLDSKTEVKTIFGKNVKGHIVSLNIQDNKSPSPNKHGEYTAFIPNIKITYEVPTVKTVALTTTIGDKTTISMIKNKKLDTTLTFKGSSVDGKEESFLLNVYRWYISPLVDPYPTDVAEFIKTNSNDFIIIKEWNEARKKQDYDFDDMSVIPNIEDDFDEFSFSELEFTGEDRDEKIIDMFSGRFIIYSVTPYSNIGKMGEEVFSNPIYIEPVTLPLE